MERLQCSWICRINIVGGNTCKQKLHIQCNPNQNIHLIVHRNKKGPNIHIKLKRKNRKSLSHPKFKLGNIGVIANPNLKICYRPIARKTNVVLVQKKTWNKNQRPNMNTPNFRHLTPAKDGKNINFRLESILNKSLEMVYLVIL